MSRDPYLEHAAVISGPAAYLLAQLLPRDDAAARLDGARIPERHREATITALDAIDRAGRAWRANTIQGSEVGTSEVPMPSGARSSVAMHTTTTTTAARTLGVSARRVLYLIDAGTLPAHREGRTWRVDAAALADLAADRRAPVTATEEHPK